MDRLQKYDPAQKIRKWALRVDVKIFIRGPSQSPLKGAITYVGCKASTDGAMCVLRCRPARCPPSRVRAPPPLAGVGVQTALDKKPQTHKSRATNDARPVVMEMVRNPLNMPETPRESGCLIMQPKDGGKLLLRLNTLNTRPIANKYREVNV
jgi:hypothetical protein